MHRTILMRKSRAERKEEWDRYTRHHPHLGPKFFGKRFRVRNDEYRIAGWLPNAPIYKVYIVRKRDHFTFAARPDEIPGVPYAD
jgi:hypothetical protein